MNSDASLPNPEDVRVPAKGWQSGAACAALPEADRTVTFFAATGDNARNAAAKAICGGCPVKEECLFYARYWRIDHGIWGGQGVASRRKMSRLPVRITCKACGAPFAATSHAPKYCGERCLAKSLQSSMAYIEREARRKDEEMFERKHQSVST